MDDLISRQAAIDDIWTVSPLARLDRKWVDRWLRQLPPIQPKRGRWIYCEDSTADCVDGYRCDQCGFFVPWDYKHKGIDFIQDYNFCPNCGAKMTTED